MFEKKESKLKLAQKEAENAIIKTNEKIDELGQATSILFSELNSIHEAFNAIRNVPTEKRLRFEELKQIRLNWKQQAEKIERDYKVATVKNAGVGAAGTSLGVAVVTMGPTVAMGVATTFGVASTGTAISALSGAAATNAALAWLGGGALAAGGGGMAAGNAFLAMAGPVGWAIAGVALLTSGFFLWKNHSDKQYLERVFTLISKRDVTSYNLATVELDERITRIIYESGQLHKANEEIRTYGLDYNSMSESQQYSLGTSLNMMHSSTQLLLNPISGLLPKYTEADYNSFEASNSFGDTIIEHVECKPLIISLANFLYNIDLNDKEKRLLTKSIKRNKPLLNSMGVTKKDLKIDIVGISYEALKYKENKN